MACDSHHERAEDQRGNDGLDKTQENSTEYLQVGGKLRPVVTDLRADDHAYDDPSCKRTPLHAVVDESGDRKPARDEVNVDGGFRKAEMSVRSRYPQHGGNGGED